MAHFGRSNVEVAASKDVIGRHLVAGVCVLHRRQPRVALALARHDVRRRCAVRHLLPPLLPRVTLPSQNVNNCYDKCDAEYGAYHGIGVARGVTRVYS